jgi:hypothetical protein
MNTPHLKKWIIGLSLVLLSMIAAAALWASFRFKPMLRERLITAIKEQYKRDVDIQELDISILSGFSATGKGFALHQKDRPGLPPLIQVKSLRVEGNLRAVLQDPIRVDRVILEGMQINIPPKQQDADKEDPPKREPPRFIIREVVADGTVLQILPKKEGREPLLFEISKLALHSAGTISPMKFEATLVNAKPPGDIYSTGEFGPWVIDDPGRTAVSGDYTFKNADLSDFKGISGTLSSEGKYKGQLDRIEVDGWTDTPNFSLNVSGQPVHLKTQFHAIVDGTDGDTYLEPVNAQFGRSSLVARGGVYGQPGVKGKTVSLDVVVRESRIEDMLRLAVKASSPLLTGAMALKAKMELPPGDKDVIEKLILKGNFELASAKFTSLNVQGKINELSQRARGQVGDRATDESVVSGLTGRFHMQNAGVSFSSLDFAVPGATVQLNGSYRLIGERLDFTGVLNTDAKVSQMTTGVKSFFLRLADPLFKKHGKGAVIPIKISGTRAEPSFGLDTGRVFSK